jgi:hypothetical protein
MNKLVFFVLFGLLTLGAGCSSPQVIFTPSQSTSSTSPLVTDASLPNWQIVDAGTFMVSLPPGWKFNKLQGIDSYVGEFIGDGAKLEFDYGWYSNSLAEDNDPNHVVTYETIDGYRAKIVIPKVTGDGTVGVYFSDLDGEQKTKLQLSGQNLGASQQEAALKMFHTLKFKK